MAWERKGTFRVRVDGSIVDRFNDSQSAATAAEGLKNQNPASEVRVLPPEYEITIPVPLPEVFEPFEEPVPAPVPAPAPGPTPEPTPTTLGPLPLKDVFESAMIDPSLNNLGVTFGDHQFPGQYDRAPTDYTWPSNTVVVENDYCYNGSEIYKIASANDAGTTGDTEPAWNTSGRTADNTCTWTHMGNAASQVFRGSATLGNGYYDALWVWHNIWQYRKNVLNEGDKYEPFVRFARSAYRDEAWRLNNVNPVSRFPMGLYVDSLLPPQPHWSNSDVSTVEDVTRIIDNGPFHSLGEFIDQGGGEYYAGGERALQREVAYLGLSLIIEEKMGEPRRGAMLEHIVNWLLNHFYQAMAGAYTHPTASYRYHQPFQAGLAAHTLTTFYDWEVENGRDPNVYVNGSFPLQGNGAGQCQFQWATIPQAIEEYFYWLHNEALTNTGERMLCAQTNTNTRPYSCGGTNYHSFRYASMVTPQEEGSGFDLQPSPALNNLMLPAYGWMGKYINDNPGYVKSTPWNVIDWFNAADKLFEASFSLIDWDYDLSGKAFNQAYRHAFDYINIRNTI